MTVDTDEELKALRRIGEIVALALEEMKAHLRPGITTRELDEIGGQFLHDHGAHSAPILVYNFPGETCISVNDEAAHGIPGERVIQAGELVNIDISAELDGFFADTAASVPVPPVSALQQHLCDCTQTALRQAIRSARAGEPMSVIGRAVERQASQCGFHVIRNLGGHGVGRNIHEEPRFIYNYENPADRRVLKAGQVITIEPFLSTGADLVVASGDGWTLRTPDGSLSAQYEHTLVITREEPIVITALSQAL
jgi:methionyl aminopeptidase